MTGKEIIDHLVSNGYSIMLVAKHSGVPYRYLYNRHKGITETELKTKDLHNLQRFAIRQPCFDGVEL